MFKSKNLTTEFSHYLTVFYTIITPVFYQHYFLIIIKDKYQK